MRAERKRRGLMVYELEWSDRVWQAVEQLARMQAETLTDQQAAQVGALFPQWQAGMSYQAGHLYRVVQSHTSQAGWPMDSTPALYTPLGVTAEDPDAIPEWVQPTGTQDAYQTGDKVRYAGEVYISLVDGNVWVPGTDGLWQKADSTEE